MKFWISKEKVAASLEMGDHRSRYWMNSNRLLVMIMKIPCKGEVPYHP